MAAAVTSIAPDARASRKSFSSTRRGLLAAMAMAPAGISAGAASAAECGWAAAADRLRCALKPLPTLKAAYDGACGQVADSLAEAGFSYRPDWELERNENALRDWVARFEPGSHRVMEDQLARTVEWRDKLGAARQRFDVVGHHRRWSDADMVANEALEALQDCAPPTAIALVEKVQLILAAAKALQVEPGPELDCIAEDARRIHHS